MNGNEITTDHHHVFFVPQEPLDGYLAQHLRIMEGEGWRVVSTTVYEGELMVAMVRG